jgi:osmotically-inducible protein OsmY
MNNDSQLQGSVLDEIKWWPNVDAAHIGVAAQDGIVTLTGQVASYTAKAAAEDATKSVYGVKGIANDIKVEWYDSDKRSDQDIAAAAVNAMKWDFEVPGDKLKVVVKAGMVTLSGTVDWQYQKDAAERCVKYLTGVISVLNSIAIKPASKWSDVKTKIENALWRNVHLDARRINVSTLDGTVTLSGSVSSWYEREQAVASAWSAPGVSWVKDDLTIES